MEKKSYSKYFEKTKKILFSFISKGDYFDLKIPNVNFCSGHFILSLLDVEVELLLHYMHMALLVNIHENKTNSKT